MDSAWHAVSTEDVVQRLQTSAIDGLSSAEVERRLAIYGRNVLREESRPGILRRLARQFHNVLLYVLIVAAVVAAILEHWLDAAVIALVVLLNALIGFFQEGKAEHALDAIRQLIKLRAAVLRDAEHGDVDASVLVPGDVVLLEAGDRVPADMRLIGSHNCAADEAALTGESVPVEKRADAVVAADAALGDRRCAAFAGTLVTRGQARGVVVATGARTEIGRIGALLASVERGTTPLLRRMDDFGRRLTLAIVAVAVAVFVVGYVARGLPARDVFMAAISVAVAAIPEGLPAIMTVTMAIGVQRMAARNAVIRRLPAVETLGAVSVVCSDKTGTLTCNQMTVQRVYCAPDGAAIDVGGVGYAPSGALADAAAGGAPLEPAALSGATRALADAVVLCNDASLHEDATGAQWRVVGDPTEGALLALAMKAGVLPSELRLAAPRVEAIPFDAEARYMATLHARTASSDMLCAVKGAPERVFDMCTETKKKKKKRGKRGEPTTLLRVFDDDGVTLTTAPRAHWERLVDAEARVGRRVLAVAQLVLPATHRDLRHADVDGGRLALLGLVSMLDPPRPEAVAAVAACADAGIRVVMITGDHAVTARAIAEQLRLFRALGYGDVERGGDGDGEHAVVTGPELETTSMDVLRELARRVRVFARANPEHKLRLVRAIKLNGDIVAMTGDGVNDAPALKQADVGVAMGLKGTEAAKQAASMVLLDDNFASVAHAIEEGRTVYDKLRKTVTFLLPINGGESLSIVAAIVLGEALPIAPIQILWVNMISAVVLALSLAWEPTESFVMRRPPRPANEALMSSFLAWRVVFVSALFVGGIFGSFEWSLRTRAATLDRARTVAVNALICMEAFYLLSVRRMRLPVLCTKHTAASCARHWRTLLALLTLLALQALFTYAPFMQLVFHTVTLPFTSVLFIFALGTGVFVTMEVEKLARLWVLRKKS